MLSDSEYRYVSHDRNQGGGWSMTSLGNEGKYRLCRFRKNDLNISPSKTLWFLFLMIQSILVMELSTSSRQYFNPYSHRPSTV